MNKNLYLTDEQYLHLLDKISDTIPKFDAFQVIDSTQIGNKYTISNIGLCNEEFVELDTSMFPDEFIKHGRKSMKYPQNHHICPFDNRLSNVENKKATNMSNGCYYTCSLKNKRTNKEKMFSLVERAKNLMLEGNSKKTVDEINNLYFNRH